MIKALREIYPFLMGDENARLGLKEAKDAVDAALAAGKLHGV
jgi:ribosomal protein L7/L12